MAIRLREKKEEKKITKEEVLNNDLYIENEYILTGNRYSTPFLIKYYFLNIVTYAMMSLVLPLMTIICMFIGKTMFNELLLFDMLVPVSLTGSIYACLITKDMKAFLNKKGLLKKYSKSYINRNPFKLFFIKIKAYDLFIEKYAFFNISVVTYTKCLLGLTIYLATKNFYVSVLISTVIATILDKFNMVSFKKEKRIYFAPLNLIYNTIICFVASKITITSVSSIPVLSIIFIASLIVLGIVYFSNYHYLTHGIETLEEYNFQNDYARTSFKTIELVKETIFEKSTDRKHVPTELDKAIIENTKNSKEQYSLKRKRDEEYDIAHRTPAYDPNAIFESAKSTPRKETVMIPTKNIVKKTDPVKNSSQPAKISVPKKTASIDIAVDRANLKR